MNPKLKKQKEQLQQALEYANIIEGCDKGIEDCNGIDDHVSSYKSARKYAIEKYIEVVSQIVESSIDIAEENSKSISDNLFETIGTITKQYAITNGINLR